MQNYQSYKTDLAPAIPASRDGLGRILAVHAGALISFTPQEFIHPQELTLYSSQDLTGINFEVTYTDKFNHLQTVYINGAASNTVKHTNIWFKKIHSIKASANINSVLEIGYYGCIYLLDPSAYSFYFLRLTEDINLEIVKNLGFSSCYLYVIPDNHIINFNFNYLVSGGGSITPPISPYIVHIITIDSTYFMNVVGSSSGSSGAMTANEILTALKTVDGVGSGLDADYLRGATGGGAEFWKPITTYNITPTSSSTITMSSDLTDIIKPGMGLRYNEFGSYCYGVVVSITPDLLTVAGVPLIGLINSLDVLSIPVIVYPEMYVEGEFTESSTITMGFKTKMYLPVSPIWRNIPAYLCRVQVATKNDDTGASIQATINITINGVASLEVPLTIPDGVRVSTLAHIFPNACRIKAGDILELTINPPSGGTPAYDAADLFVELDFVPEVI